MSETLKNSLADLIKKRGTNPRRVALDSGMEATAVRAILIGKSQDPKYGTLKKIARVLDVGVEQLAEGTWRNLRQAADTPTQAIEYEEDTYIGVPRYRLQVAAGDAKDGPGRPEIINHMLFRREWIERVTAAPIDRVAIVTVDGDSMHPTLQNGDVVLMDTTQTTPTAAKEIFVINRDGALQVKRVHVDGSRIRVDSDNAEFGAARDINPEYDDILGRVIWLGRKV